MIELPIASILATICTQATTIATLAAIMWAFMKSRLAAQDKIIDGQSVTIAKLQDDVERLSKGCGHQECLWRGR